MAFFEFKQNNSGGGFDVDHAAGISHVVIIEADSAEDANRKAESIGLYFDGAGDCSCCGYRWSEAWSREGAAVPSYYGTPIQDVQWDGPDGWKWIKNGPEAYVHFKDGTIQGYGLPQKQL